MALCQAGGIFPAIQMRERGPMIGFRKKINSTNYYHYDFLGHRFSHHRSHRRRTRIWRRGRTRHEHRLDSPRRGHRALPDPRHFRPSPGLRTDSDFRLTGPDSSLMRGVRPFHFLGGSFGLFAPGCTWQTAGFEPAA